jgi:hypothetical protein
MKIRPDKIQPRYSFTIQDLIVLMVAGKVIRKGFPVKDPNRKKLNTAIRRAAVIIRGQ